MKLLIISHTPHYLDHHGQVLGWGPTLREIDRLATLFEIVRHVAWLHPDPPPDSSRLYGAQNVHFIPVPCSGGAGLVKKVGVLWKLPLYAVAILRELPKADVVHVRCPASISLLALVLLALSRKPVHRWVKYAGDWRPDRPTPWSYSLQRWLLRRRIHRGVVTVNGQWQEKLVHVIALKNPCLTRPEVQLARIEGARKKLGDHVQLLFVGHLVADKGVGRALETVAEVRRRGLEATLDLVGDSRDRRQWESMAARLGVAEHCRFHGWLGRSALDSIYAKAHLLLCPSSSEGWPKTLSEGMAWGVVPVAGAISSIPQILEEVRCGTSVDPLSVEGFVESILEYCKTSGRWARERDAGLNAINGFTYETYLEVLRSAFLDSWGLKAPLARAAGNTP